MCTVCLSCNHSLSSMMISEGDDGVQLHLMSASVTEQANSRFANPATHITHTHTCLRSSSGSSRHCDVAVFT